VRHGVEMKFERGEHLLSSLGRSDEAPSVCDAKCGEAEAGCGDARYEAAVACARRALIEGAIHDLPVERLDLFGEVEAGATLHVVEECVVVFGGRRGGVDFLPCGRQRVKKA